MAEKKFLSLDTILAAPDVNETDVEVPEWGGSVKVRALTKADQIRIRKSAMRRDQSVDDVKMEAGLLVAGLVDPVISEAQVPDLFEKNSTAVDRVLQAILGLSGLDDTAVDSSELTLKS